MDCTVDTDEVHTNRSPTAPPAGSRGAVYRRHRQPKVPQNHSKTLTRASSQAKTGVRSYFNLRIEAADSFGDIAEFDRSNGQVLVHPWQSVKASERYVDLKIKSSVVGISGKQLFLKRTRLLD